jgi:NADPH-dependent 2,4-dienoyl-CoA reductase/sulfur reductase-like enzyme
MSGGVLIVGGGLAAQRCAETLRARGFDEPVRIVCGEDEAPYDRPPLSKAVLAGTAADDSVAFRDRGWYSDNAVELILGRRATALDAPERRVELDDGESLAYDALVIATGAAPRTLPMFERFDNAISLRTLEDSRRLRRELASGGRIAIVGAGFIGQEVASTARAAGADVIVIEALERPLGPLLGDEVAEWLIAMHREEGARVLVGARLEAVEGNGRAERLTLEGGERIECDAVVVGVGVAPQTEWLRGSGLDLDGVRTDPVGRTSLPRVYAAGDVARPYDVRLGDHARTEHWDAASRQGAAVARAILGDIQPPATAPSFWSDQYGSRIQYAGHAFGAEEIHIQGDVAGRDFAVTYRRGGRTVAGLTVNRPRELASIRKVIDAEHADLDNEEIQK